MPGTFTHLEQVTLGKYIAQSCRNGCFWTCWISNIGHDALLGHWGILFCFCFFNLETLELFGKLSPNVLAVSPFTFILFKTEVFLYFFLIGQLREKQKLDTFFAGSLQGFILQGRVEIF